jgi:hypothetical protein
MGAVPVYKAGDLPVLLPASSLTTPVDRQRNPVCGAYRLPMALPAWRIPALVHGVLVSPAVGGGRARWTASTMTFARPPASPWAATLSPARASSIRSRCAPPTPWALPAGGGDAGKKVRAGCAHAQQDRPGREGTGVADDC